LPSSNIITFLLQSFKSRRDSRVIIEKFMTLSNTKHCRKSATFVINSSIYKLEVYSNKFHNFRAIKYKIITLIHQHLWIEYFGKRNMKCQLNNNVMRILTIENNWWKGKSKRHNAIKKFIKRMKIVLKMFISKVKIL